MKKLKEVLSSEVVSDYIAGTTAAWTVYTPVFAGLEFHQGYSFEQVAWARGIGMGLHMVAGPALQYTRRFLAKNLGVYKDQGIKRFLVDEAAVAIVQPAAYLTILSGTALATGQSTNEFRESCSELMPTGLAIALACAPFFGMFVDGFWKKHIFRNGSTFLKRPDANLDDLVE